MKNKLILTGISFIGLFAATSALKVTICHNVDNNPHAITIAASAAVAHFLQHPNYTLGDCSTMDDDGGVK